MGAWGLGSDENDWTYDQVGLDIYARMTGISLTEEGRSANGFIKAIVEGHGSSDVLNNEGVVILLLKLGCNVPLTNLHLVRENLAHENHEELFPENANERKDVVEQELKMIDAAIENGGSVKGPPIGVRGIAGGMK